MRADKSVGVFFGYAGASLVLSLCTAACGGATASQQPGADGGVDTGTGVHPAHDAGAPVDARDLDSPLRMIDVGVSLDSPIGSHDTGTPQPDTGVTLDGNVGKPDAHINPTDGASLPDAPATDAASSCPATAPANLAMCTTVGQDCDYGTTQCDCSAMKAWECHVCPAVQPAAGSMCMGAGFGGADTCGYGSTECVCNGGTWACGTCPGTAPANASMCMVAGLDCPYTDSTCRCEGAAGPGGGGDTWRCVDACPATEPGPGAMCDTGAQQCTYGATTCLCMGGTFFCN
jgi:hypothetical protein